MPQQKFRFAAGSPNGPRSAVWSLFWRRHDAYLSAVEARGVAKVSFHLKTGEFSWGYTREYYDAHRNELPPMRSRDFERWHRPPEYAKGLTAPLRIFIANEALKVDRELPTAKTIHWSSPRPGKAIGFLVVIAAPEIVGNPYSDETDLELLVTVSFAEHRERLILYAHHIEQAIVSNSANASIIDFTQLYPTFEMPQKHRMYTQTEGDQPDIGARSLVEIPTYVLPFTSEPL